MTMVSGSGGVAHEAQLGVLQTMGRYVHLVDAGRGHELLELFTPDGVLHPHGLDECRGREAIAQFLARSGAARRSGPSIGPIRHHVSSVLVEVEDESRASARSYFLAMNAVGPDHWGRYTDRLVNVDGTWLFARRAVRIEGAAPDGWIGSGRGPVTFSAAATAPRSAE